MPASLWLAPGLQRSTGPGAVMASQGFLTRHGNILLYVPNLIGYARIAATLYALAVAFHHPLACIVSYFLSFVCDELDGRAARTLNQQSTLGAVLDMVTDRVATTGLLVVLAVLYPSCYVASICLIALDIFSHWFQMYETLLAGSRTHKDVCSRSWLVRTYYSNRIFMGFCCICCEVMYLALYLLAWPEYRSFAVLPLRIPPAAVAVAAQLAPLLPGGGAAALLAGLRQWQGLPFVGLVALLAVPGVLVKQACNWVQLRTAVQGLVDHDLKHMQ